MRCFNQGSEFRVTISAQEVSNFMDGWPCSGLNSRQGLSFTFDKRNGDLTDMNPSDTDGEAALALSHIAQAYGAKKLRIKDAMPAKSILESMGHEGY